jgi:Spy/CpxP family protein refolding chaperone
MQHDARTRLTTAIILVVVFGSGVMLGLAADSNLSAEAPAAEARIESPDPSKDAPEDSVETPRSERRYIYQQVDPNEAQLSRIDSIVAELRAVREVLDEEYQTSRRELVLETRNAIKAVLSPEQAAEYQRLLDEWDARNAAESENEDDRD